MSTVEQQRERSDRKKQRVEHRATQLKGEKKSTLEIIRERVTRSEVRGRNAKKRRCESDERGRSW